MSLPPFVIILSVSSVPNKVSESEVPFIVLI